MARISPLITTTANLTKTTESPVPISSSKEQLWVYEHAGKRDRDAQTVGTSWCFLGHRNISKSMTRRGLLPGQE